MVFSWLSSRHYVHIPALILNEFCQFKVRWRYLFYPMCTITPNSKDRGNFWFFVLRFCCCLFQQQLFCFFCENIFRLILLCSQVCLFALCCDSTGFCLCRNIVIIFVSFAIRINCSDSYKTLLLFVIFSFKWRLGKTDLISIWRSLCSTHKLTR